MIYNSIIEAVGNTPLVKLNRVNKGIKGTILAKIEYFNPGNSIKDRVAVKMISDAEKAGKIKPGGTIIEGTSGNTGMGLALTAIAKGYKCICTMSDKQSQEKIDILKAVGAKVVVCPSNVDSKHPQSYGSVAKKLHAEIKNSFYPNQYDNTSNSNAHYESTGPEIWQQTNGAITHYVAAAGTGGSLSGTARYLKEKKKNVLSIGIDSYGSILKKYKETGEIDQKEIYPYLTEGFGQDVVPDNIHMQFIDRFIKVTDKDGALMARRLAREEGLFVGWSSGSIVHGALEYAVNNLKEGDTMVLILPDHGTRYLNKIYSDSWMEKNGFLEHHYATAKDIIEQRQGKSPLHTLSKTMTVREALSIMIKDHDISQAPVVDRGDFVGCLNAQNVLEKLINTPSTAEEHIEKIMEAPMPFVSMSTTLDVLHAKLNKSSGGVLVNDLDEEIHIITKHDLLNMISWCKST